MPREHHTLRFPGTIDGFKEAMATVSRLLEVTTLDLSARHNVLLVFEEVAANIVRHASPTEPVLADLVLDDHEVVLTFEDDGAPFDPREHPEPPAPASIEEARIGGLGVWLVKHFTTRLDYERTSDEHNRLTVAVAI